MDNLARLLNLALPLFMYGGLISVIAEIVQGPTFPKVEHNAGPYGSRLASLKKVGNDPLNYVINA